MPRRHLSIVSLCISFLLAGACDPVNLTDLNPGGFGACCDWRAPQPCTTTCPAMDPNADQIILLGDTLDIFYNGGTVATSWTYDPAAFAAVQPADLVTHRGVTVSHIALIALKTGTSAVKASAAAAEGVMKVETIPSAEMGGTGVTTLRCYHMGVTDPSCPGTKYPWDTASFKTGDTMRVVSTSWDRNGRIVNARARLITSTNPAVAIVSRIYSEYYTAWLPIVIAIGPGTATIGASAGGFSGSSDVTVAK